MSKSLTTSSGQAADGGAKVSSLKSARKMLPVALTAACLLSLVTAGDFPIGVWSGDGLSSCNDVDMLAPVADMGCTLLFHELDEDDDLEEALAVLEAVGAYGLKVIVKPNWSRYKWVRGQLALYAAHGPVFDHTAWVGQGDDASEAWTALAGINPPGWLQRDLLINYQQGEEAWTAPSEYDADFFLATGDTAADTVLATLYAVSRDTTAASETILDSLVIHGTDFSEAGTLQSFRLHFSCAGLPYSRLMDYRIYWTGAADLTVVSTLVSDSLSQSLQLAHAYDAAMASEIDAFQSSAGYDNLLWWDLIDEPALDQLPGAHYIYSRLQSAGEQPFLNFYPDYAGQYQHESPDFDTYLTEFVTAVQPPVLSFDHYPFGWTADAPDLPQFFADLAHFRQKSLELQIPFWYTGQGFNFNDLGAVDEPRARLCFFSALAYGAGGVMWWRFKSGLTDNCFEPNAFYVQAQSVNTDIRRIGPELTALTSTAAAALPFDPLPPGLVVSAIAGDSLALGSFTSDSLGGDWFMLVNLRYDGNEPYSPQITLAPASGPRLVEDLLTLRSPEADSLHFGQLLLPDGQTEFSVALLPGEGRLYHISSDLLPGDLNRDGGLTVGDVVVMVALILTEEDLSVHELWAGDLSGDGAVDILDIVQLVTIILDFPASEE